MYVAPVLRLPGRDGGDKRRRRVLEALAAAELDVTLLAPRAYDDATRAERDALVGAAGWTLVEYDPPGRRPADPVVSVLRWPVGPRHPALARTIEALAAEHDALLCDGLVLGSHLVGAPLPTVVHLFDANSEVHARLAATSGADARRRLGERYRALQCRRAERQVARRADRVVCVSAEDAAHFARSGARTDVAANGVDDEFFAVGDAPASGQVLFFGSMAWQPNADGLARWLAEGWPGVLSARPDARLVVVGAGAPRELASLAADTPNVELRGFVDDLPAVMAESQVVVAPVWSGGGTRLKVLEAMGAGRAVVGTSLAVERLGFVDGVHGVVADEPAELAARLADLLDDPGRSRALGERARRLAEGARWSATLEPFLAAVREVAR